MNHSDVQKSQGNMDIKAFKNTLSHTLEDENLLVDKFDEVIIRHNRIDSLCGPVM